MSLVFHVEPNLISSGSRLVAGSSTVDGFNVLNHRIAIEHHEVVQIGSWIAMPRN